MITVFDSNNYAQQVFMAEAYATLLGKGCLSPAEIDAGKFLSLDGYFAHMKHLAVIPKFVIIPGDEAPFEINANTRSITVPPAFSKCAGVVGDNMCEIITFTIDRYFDYVDLANSKICIQWKLPDTADGPGLEGISQVGIIDLTTLSGKIRFGWPLTKELTKHAGNITFSIRFYIEKVIDEEKDETQFVYLFNTLPATIPIKSSLNVQGETVFVEQGVADLFKDFVENSTNPSFPMPEPVGYVVNLLEQEKVNEANDTLTLRAQATTTGDGWIDYKWFLKEGISDKTDLTAIPMEIVSNDVFNVNHKVYLEAPKDKDGKQDWTKIPKNRQYYVLVEGEAEGGKFQRVEYKLDNGTHTFTNVVTNAPIDEDTILYERYTQLTIKARNKKYDDEGNFIGWETTEESKKITGLYYVEAINSVGKTSIDVVYSTKDIDGNDVTLKYSIPGVNSTAALASKECYVPTPREIKIENDLANDIFIDPVNDAILKISPEKDPGNPQRTYVWNKYIADDIDFEAMKEAETEDWILKESAVPEKVDEGVDKVNYITDVPGWYQVDIESLLNRDTENKKSRVCRVVDLPEKPIVKTMSYSVWSGRTPNEADDWNYVFKDDEVKDTDGITEGVQGQIFSLKVDVDESFLSDKLKSDKLTYQWYVITPDDKPDSEGRLIEAADMDENGIIFDINDVTSNVLNVQCPASGPVYSYYCKITNTLAKQTSEFGQKDYKVTFLIS